MKYQNLELDPFQVEACAAIDRGESVIVAAPTGCGKTLIAEYAVEESVKQGKRAVYTAPIKALSNQKFRDFRARFGNDAVGIQTGDVTINPDAQLLIMTTEIFRNLILENSGRLDDIYYCIFDEIHYLDDPERGTVWEESIILAPPGIRFMCLSATVPNIAELAGWMGAVRDTTFRVIEETHRPVPLQHYFFHPKFGFISTKTIARKYKNSPEARKRFSRRKPSSRKIVQFVIHEGHLPVLYFCFNRRSCERNAEQHMRHLDLLNDDERGRVRQLVDELVHQYGIKDYDRLNFLKELWESGIGYHHAGILPAAKEIVERLFTMGLIKLLFCTETFALGVNMPASAVIFDELEKFDGVEFNYLMTREYNQMAGRAGRRGMDSVGYVYSQVIPEATDPRQLERILHGNNERINSRFYASYSTILSLYSQFGENVYDIFRKSLHNFRKGTFSMSKAYQKEEAQIKNRIKFLQASGFLDGKILTPKGQLAAAVSGYEIQTAELYYSRNFENVPTAQLPVILAALITEESRSRKAAPVSHMALKFDAEKTIRKLRQKEIKYNIEHPIREMDFSLAAPIFAWANGCDLGQLADFGVPEGDLIRILRMAVQLLRTLRDRIPDPVVSDKMHEALELINRDVVDAQAQLEVG